MAQAAQTPRVAASVTWSVQKDPDVVKVILADAGNPVAEYTLNMISLARVTKGMAALAAGLEVPEDELEPHENQLVGFVASTYELPAAEGIADAMSVVLRIVNGHEYDEEVGQAVTIYVSEEGHTKANMIAS